MKKYSKCGECGGEFLARAMQKGKCASCAYPTTGHSLCSSGCTCGQPWNDDYDCCETQIKTERAKLHNRRSTGSSGERTYPM